MNDNAFKTTLEAAAAATGATASAGCANGAAPGCLGEKGYLDENEGKHRIGVGDGDVLIEKHESNLQ